MHNALAVYTAPSGTNAAGAVRKLHSWLRGVMRVTGQTVCSAP